MRHDIISVVLVLATFTPCTLYAGALDRGPMQERYNPAAKDMLRIPGVVGTYEDQALATLQQAGLAVSVKRITKDNPKYEGKEGMVIRQVPSAGGVAMVGSSINIIVYKTGKGYQQGGYGDQWSDGAWQGDEQQGYDEPIDNGQWGEGNNENGWQPPVPGDDTGGGMDEPGFEDNLDIGIGDSAPNVPAPSGSLRTPDLRKPVGKGGIVGKPVMPSRTPVKPSATRDELMTPEQKRALNQKIKDARSGKRTEIQPGRGIIVAKPVHVPVQRVNSNAGNVNRSPRLPKVVPSRLVVSPVPESVAGKTKPIEPVVPVGKSVAKPAAVGTQGIVMGTAKPADTVNSKGIVMGTAKPKVPSLNQRQQPLKKDETESGSQSWFQQLFK